MLYSIVKLRNWFDDKVLLETLTRLEGLKFINLHFAG
jgi:hypothetical protein